MTQKLFKFFPSLQSFGLFAKSNSPKKFKGSNYSPHPYWKRKKSSIWALSGGKVGIPCQELIVRDVAAYT